MKKQKTNQERKAMMQASWARTKQILNRPEVMAVFKRMKNR